jgi:hypothetical protein
MTERRSALRAIVCIVAALLSLYNMPGLHSDPVDSFVLGSFAAIALVVAVPLIVRGVKPFDRVAGAVVCIIAAALLFLAFYSFPHF